MNENHKIMFRVFYGILFNSFDCYYLQCSDYALNYFINH
ncbi:hypothetical protein CDIMF43_50020 [Carnobacterium divergens]|nr:hypothetical protein CDIV41_50085 [Carnobacterium divergens]SPC41602.1 hypothetical protein CDIMF43_50020 [Carnobacterium divergens]